MELAHRYRGQWGYGRKAEWPVETTDDADHVNPFIFEHGLIPDRRNWLSALRINTVRNSSPSILDIGFASMEQQFRIIRTWLHDFDPYGKDAVHWCHAFVCKKPEQGEIKGKDMTRFFTQVLRDAGQKYGNMYCSNMHWLIQNGAGFLPKVILRWTEGSRRDLYVFAFLCFFFFFFSLGVLSCTFKIFSNFVLFLVFTTARRRFLFY